MGYRYLNIIVAALSLLAVNFALALAEEGAAITGSANDVPNLMIVGGNVVDKGFPYFAALMYESWEGMMPYCGSTLINERFLLTAAHCQYQSFPPDQVAINVYKIDPMSPEAIIRTVKRVIIHPDYNPEELSNDICLIELAEPVLNATYVKLAPEDLSLKGKTTVQAIGFGATKEGNRNTSNEMRRVYLPILPLKQCRKAGGDYEHTPNSTICTAKRGKDACQGDSGGPLLTRDGVQVGITSWGVGCARGREAPGVFTKVASFRDWIEANAVPSAN